MSEFVTARLATVPGPARGALRAHLDSTTIYLRMSTPLPLTPAFSLRERVDTCRARLCGQRWVLDAQPRTLPLPEGEGWGEGERRVELSRSVVLSRCARALTLHSISLRRFCLCTYDKSIILNVAIG